MFEAEAKGLELLRQSQSFQIPDVKSVGNTMKTHTYSSVFGSWAKSESFWEHFGQLLALLHQKQRSTLVWITTTTSEACPNTIPGLQPLASFILLNAWNPNLGWPANGDSKFKIWMPF